MAYEYDRFEREDGGGSFLMGLLAGTVLGAGLGMLFAPRAGSELRRQVGEQAGRLKSTATDAYSNASERVTHMVDRGREAYDRARHSGTAGSSSMSETGSMGNTGSTSGSMAGTPYTTAGTENR